MVNMSIVFKALSTRADLIVIPSTFACPRTFSHDAIRFQGRLQAPYSTRLMQAKILVAIKPILRNMKLINLQTQPPSFAQQLLHIITKTRNTPRSVPVNPTEPVTRTAPDESAVRQMCDMGISAAQARDALVQTGYGVSTHPPPSCITVNLDLSFKAWLQDLKLK